MGEATRKQPDDPGHDGETFIEPLIFGRKSRHHVSSVIRTIHRNAGKMPKEDIAQAVCWSVEHLERQAFKHGIDLTYPRAAHLEDVEPAGT